MLKYLRFLLLFVILLAACYPIKQVIKNNYLFDKDISFTVDQVSEGSTLSGGYQSFYAKKGYKLVFITFTFKNNSDKKKELDMGKINLFEPKTRTRSLVEYALAVSLVNIDKKVDTEIAAGEVLRRVLVYVFPKKETPETFMIDNEIYNFKYSE